MLNLDNESWRQQRQPFLEWLIEWNRQLHPLALGEIKTAQTALLSIDLIRGFCTIGPLASPRVQEIVPEVVALFKKLHEQGVQHFILTQDTHSETTPEFGTFAPHCLAGTAESETIPELAELPFAHAFHIIPKNSLSSTVGTELPAWLTAHPEINTFIIVGDCTDLCIFQAAMDLRLQANAANRADVRVIVPADCVQTYDLPIPIAQQLGALPHDGDLLHAIFLYMLALNGVEVVAHLE
jgi:nicotinamidase-related amidase